MQVDQKEVSGGGPTARLSPYDLPAFVAIKSSVTATLAADIATGVGCGPSTAGPSFALLPGSFSASSIAVSILSRRFLGTWCAVAGASALGVSALDAVLLQRRESYFTGGFLSDDHLRGAWDVLAFSLTSILADAAIVGMLAGIAMWTCSRLRLSVRATVVAGVMAGVGPLVIANVISYQLLRYVGDALDFSLAMELTGGSLAEIFAVTSSHLVFPAVSIASLGSLGGGLIWLINRYDDGERSTPLRLRVLVPAVVLFVCAVGAVATATSLNDRLANGLMRKPSGEALAGVAAVLTDVDRDGFGLGARLSDPDPLNAAVYPYAVEIAGNGIDENGVGGDLPVDADPFSETTAVPSVWRQQQDVLLVVLESYRADLIGASHRGQAITPVLNALASRGVSSAAAYSPNGFTSQSRFHLFSGSLAGARAGTLVDDFKQQGYFVAYFSGQDESFGGRRYDVGFSRADFAYDARSDRARRYSTFSTPGSLAVPFAVVQERVQEFLNERNPSARPLFMYVNFHDTHFPYTHDGVHALLSEDALDRGEISPEMRDRLWSTYVNTAANVDRAVGQLIEAVRAARGREPAVIITADHGESLYDDGFLGHGHALNEVQTRVPLVAVNLPLTIEEPFTHVDLRDAIGRAMGQLPGAVATVRRSASRAVFQYVGTIERPRQIAWLRDGGRIIYDFRVQRVQRDGGAWQQPGALEPVARAEFDRLVWHWERMRIARAQVADAS